MKKLMALVAVALVGFTPAAMAQHNGAADLLDSPVKVEAELQNIGEQVHCSLPIPQATALFGASEIKGTVTNEFLIGELMGSYHIYRVDSDCNLIESWQTACPGTSMTGITYDTTTDNTYWAADPSSGQIYEFEMFTGFATGNVYTLPNAGTNVWGPGTIDDNQSGRLSYWSEITTDEIFQVDLADGSFGCSFVNPDFQQGLGAFGNGIDDAANPALNDTGLVLATGQISDGQPVRVSQTDCSGNVYEDTWNLIDPLLPSGEIFPNGIVEYYRSSSMAPQKNLLVVGNATSTVFVLDQDLDIDDCQGIDDESSSVLFVNGDQGEQGVHTITMPAGTPLAYSMDRPADGGNGKFVVHFNAGIPSAETIRPLPANLGTFCFPLLFEPADNADPSAVWNNIGKPNRIGASNYFGSPIADPERAPAFFHLDPNGDIEHLPSGSEWTVQGVVFNPASTSPRGVSVTNAIQLRIE